jgi:hypothetical protein
MKKPYAAPQASTSTVVVKDGRIVGATPHSATRDLMQHCTAPDSGMPEELPEYFAKPGIVEGLSEVHPVALVRQMANEILRLRAYALAQREKREGEMSVRWDLKNPDDYYVNPTHLNPTRKALLEAFRHALEEHRTTHWGVTFSGEEVKHWTEEMVWMKAGEAAEIYALLVEAAPSGDRHD